ncbi:MAG TPA: hypothetical protein VGG56_11805 [Terracidiphilus sp.]
MALRAEHAYTSGTQTFQRPQVLQSADDAYSNQVLHRFSTGNIPESGFTAQGWFQIWLGKGLFQRKMGWEPVIVVVSAARKFFVLEKRTTCEKGKPFVLDGPERLIFT